MLCRQHERAWCHSGRWLLIGQRMSLGRADSGCRTTRSTHIQKNYICIMSTKAHHVFTSTIVLHYRLLDVWRTCIMHWPPFRQALITRKKEIAWWNSNMFAQFYSTHFWGCGRFYLRTHILKLWTSENVSLSNCRHVKFNSRSVFLLTSGWILNT